MPRLLASMTRFSIWSLMPRPCRPPMRLSSLNSSNSEANFWPADAHRNAALEGELDLFRLDLRVALPVRHAHDWVDDVQAFVEPLQVFRFVRRAQHVRVRAVGFLGAHRVRQADFDEVFAHLFAAAERVDELLIEPRLVDLQVRVGQDAVAIETLDVVALVGAAIAEDVHVVFTHRADDRGRGHGATERRGVEVFLAAARQVEGAALNRRQAFLHHPPRDNRSAGLPRRRARAPRPESSSDPSRPAAPGPPCTSRPSCRCDSATRRRSACRARPKKRCPASCLPAATFDRSGSWPASLPPAPGPVQHPANANVD